MSIQSRELIHLFEHVLRETPMYYIKKSTEIKSKLNKNEIMLLNRFIYKEKHYIVLSFYEKKRKWRDELIEVAIYSIANHDIPKGVRPIYVK